MRLCRMNAKGFTLIELMIAVSILVITLGASLQVLQNAQTMSQESRERFYAANAGRSVIEAIKNTSLVNVPNISTPQYVPSGLSGGTITIATNPSPVTASTTVATVTITVNWTSSKNRARSMTFTTMRSKY